jgi:hypothetical protein
MTTHPSTYSLPRGGRRIAPRAVAPTVSLRTRVNQLMPVGLLVVATSTAVAVMLPHGGSTGAGQPSAAASPHPTAAGLTAGITGAGSPTDEAAGSAAMSATGLGSATLTGGRHRAAGLADDGTASLPATGKHRLHPAPKHADHANEANQSNQSNHADHAGPKHQADPAPAATPSTATPSASTPASSTPATPSASTTPSTSATPSATPTLDSTPSPSAGLVDGILDDVLDGVGGLLHGPKG